MKPLRGCLLAFFLVVLSALAACAAEEPSPPPERSSAEETTAPATTGDVALSTVPETTSEETTGGVGEGTLGASVETPEAVLRLEGDDGTRFSGICDVGGGENVLSGQVPKRFTFEDLGGAELSCRIQKQDERRGILRVILLSGDTTRSVQQTNAPGGTIEVSFSG
jgi:hypothetical protein